MKIKYFKASLSNDCFIWITLFWRTGFKKSRSKNHFFQFNLLITFLVVSPLGFYFCIYLTLRASCQQLDQSKDFSRLRQSSVFSCCLCCIAPRLVAICLFDAAKFESNTGNQKYFRFHYLKRKIIRSTVLEKSGLRKSWFGIANQSTIWNCATWGERQIQFFSGLQFFFWIQL